MEGMVISRPPRKAAGDTSTIDRNLPPPSFAGSLIRDKTSVSSCANWVPVDFSVTCSISLSNLFKWDLMSESWWDALREVCDAGVATIYCQLKQVLPTDFVKFFINYLYVAQH